MFELFQIATVLLVAIAMASAVGHAMEFPGKRRLSRDEYLAVQPIYYPGYTIFGGAGEVLGLLATLGWAAAAYGSEPFALVLSAFLAMAAMHAIYWLVTHPVNRFWLKNSELNAAGRAFFDTAAGTDQTADWRRMRDRWEWSHVARAVASAAALALLVTALALY